MGNKRNMKIDKKINNKKEKKQNQKCVCKEQEEKPRKLLIIIPLLVLIIGFASLAYIYSNRTEPSVALKEYFNHLNNKEYDKMYELAETDINKEDFITRVKNIYEGIEASNISIAITANTTDSKNENNSKYTNVSYSISMNTIAGNTTFTNTAKMKMINGKYKIEWNSSDIFPNLEDNEKIRVTTLSSTRGTIYDRNGLALAKDGNVYSVGIVPGKMNETTDLDKLAELLNITKDTIQTSINASYVKEDTFVPLRKISKEEQELKNNLLKIKGIMIIDVSARVYPYKEATSIMTGYIQDGEGKSGLEYAYNDRLKGTNGAEIYIEKDGKKVKTIVKKEVKNGEDIKLTIDANLQNKLYEQFKDDEGTSVAMNYNTGELLALVSTPSYDANKFSTGITQDEWEKLQNDDNKPMYNRYLSTYAPGSSLKPLIGAIGLASNSFTAEEDFGVSGTKWQKDSSWKDLYVTTLEKYSGIANLENALVYSDNIYFAKAALRIGKYNLQQGLDNWGFNSKIEFTQDITKSTYGSMNSDASIANSGYGQGEMLANPIHMASIYSAFANGGSMMKPYIEIEKESTKIAKYYKKDVISDNIAGTIKEDLIQVVKTGTATAANIEEKTIAGKTGTAEIKESQNDNDGIEIGWFDAFDDNQTLIISMVQNVKEIGGSHYVVNKVKNVF